MASGSEDRENVILATVILRDHVPPPPDAPWLKHGVMYSAVIILVSDYEAQVRIVGPDGARATVSSRDVQRIGDDWPDH